MLLHCFSQIIIIVSAADSLHPCFYRYIFPITAERSRQRERPGLSPVLVQFQSQSSPHSGHSSESQLLISREMFSSKNSNRTCVFVKFPYLSGKGLPLTVTWLSLETQPSSLCFLSQSFDMMHFLWAFLK